MDTCLIRQCTETEALAILRDPTVLPLLAFYPIGLKDVETYLLNESALAVVMPKGASVEVHIACKFRDRAKVRKAFEFGLEWLRSRGFTEVFTTAPDERKALVNMLKSMGFHYESGKWVLKWA